MTLLCIVYFSGLGQQWKDAMINSKEAFFTVRQHVEATCGCPIYLPDQLHVRDTTNLAPAGVWGRRNKKAIARF